MDVANAQAMNVWNRQLAALRSARPPCATEEDFNSGTCATPDEQALQDALVHAQWLLTTLAAQIAVTLQKMRNTTFELVKKIIPDSRTAMDAEAQRLVAGLKQVDVEMERDLNENSKALRKERLELDDVSDLMNDLALQRSIQLSWRDKTQAVIEAYLVGLRKRNVNFRDVSDEAFTLGQEMRANLLLWNSLYEESSRKLAEINAEYQSYIAGSTVKPVESAPKPPGDDRDRTPWDLLVQQAVNQEKSKKGGLRDQQIIVGSLMGPHPGIGAPEGLLVYHDVGTGKTCTADATLRAFFDEAVKLGKTFKIVVGLPNPTLRGKWLEDINPSKPGQGCRYAAIAEFREHKGPDAGYLRVDLLPSKGKGSVELYFMEYRKGQVGKTGEKRAQWGPSPSETDAVIVDEAHNVINPTNIPKKGAWDYGRNAYEWGKKWVLSGTPDAAKRKKGQKLLLLTGTPASAPTTSASEADEGSELRDDLKELSDLYRLLKAVKRGGTELKPLETYFEQRRDADGASYFEWKDLEGFYDATRGLVSYFSYLNVPRIYPHLTVRCGGAMQSYPASDERDLGNACDYDFEPKRDEIEPLPEAKEPITELEAAARAQKEYGRWRPSYVYVPLAGKSVAARGGRKKQFKATASAAPSGSLSEDPTKPSNQLFNVNGTAENLNNKAKALVAMIRYLDRRDAPTPGKHFVFTLGETFYQAAGAIAFALSETGPVAERYEFLDPKTLIREILAYGLLPAGKGRSDDDETEEAVGEDGKKRKVTRSQKFGLWAKRWFERNQPRKRFVYLGKVSSGKFLYVYKEGELELLKEGLLALFNADENWDGGYIEVFVGSSKDAKEGLDLLGVTFLHFMDPPPNRNWYQQVQGRPLRYMAHRQRNARLYKDLPPDPEGNDYGGGPVEVFVYRWVRENSDGEREVMLDLSASHPSRYELAIAALKSNAIDCPFNRKVTRVRCVGDPEATAAETLGAADPFGGPSDGFLRVNLDGQLVRDGEIRVLTAQYGEREERILNHLFVLAQQSAASGDWSVSRVFDRFGWEKNASEPLGGHWYYDSSLRRAENPGQLRERIMNLLRLPKAAEPLTQQQASHYVLTHVLAKGHPDWLGVLTREDSERLARVLQIRRDQHPLDEAQLEAVRRRLRLDALSLFAQRAIPMLSQITLQRLPTFFGPPEELGDVSSNPPENAPESPSYFPIIE